MDLKILLQSSLLVMSWVGWKGREDSIPARQFSHFLGSDIYIRFHRNGCLKMQVRLGTTNIFVPRKITFELHTRCM